MDIQPDGHGHGHGHGHGGSNASGTEFVITCEIFFFFSYLQVMKCVYYS